MRLQSAKVQPISKECVKALIAAGDIETDAPGEVEKDIVAVLNAFLTEERKVNEKAKDLLAQTGRGMDQYGRVREQIAESHGIKVGDEALDYVLDQIVMTFHNSPSVDEIFVEDVELRRAMARVFKKHLADASEVELEIRAQLKHVQEGTQLWDVEYARVSEQFRKRRGS